MTSPSRTRWLAGLLALALVPGTVLAANQAAAPATSTSPISAQERVTVTYVHPHQFTESRQTGFGHRYNHGDYLGKLKAYLIRRATPMLQPGQHLAIAITDIDLAGGYEPWRGPQWNDVRFMRDVYPPRIDLDFKLTGADGRIIRQGTRKLRDLGYLHDLPASPSDTDSLRYDKALLDRWLRRGPAKW